MDGNEGGLSATREGIGDTGDPEKAGVSTKTPRGVNKRTLSGVTYVMPGNEVKQFTTEHFGPILSNMVVEGKKRVMESE